MDAIQLQSRVGADGVLKLSLPLGPDDANRDVIVTIRSLPVSGTQPAQPWDVFLDETYGSCAGLGLERGPQWEYEAREPLD
jgi:hypothetical protein